MDKVFIVTTTSGYVSLSRVVGAYDTMKAAKEAAYQEYCKVCKEMYGIKPRPQSNEPLRVELNGMYRTDIKVSSVDFTRTEEFQVSYVTRSDIKQQGFEASNIDNDTMEGIASRMNEYSCEGVGYWDSLDAAAEFYEIPRKEEEDEV